MRIVYDGEFNYLARAPIEDSCHLKIVWGSSRILITVTEFSDYVGWSIARSPELLASAIINKFHLNPEISIYVEHFLPRKAKAGEHENSLVRPIEAYFQLTFRWRTVNGSLPPYEAKLVQRTPIKSQEYVRLHRALYL